MIQISERHFEALQKVVEESRHVVELLNDNHPDVAKVYAAFVMRAIIRLEEIRRDEMQEVRK